jgi:hypothetical protein
MKSAIVDEVDSFSRKFISPATVQNSFSDMRFEVFMVVNLQVEVV